MSRQGFATGLSPYLIGFSVPRFYLPLSPISFLSLSLSLPVCCVIFLNSISEWYSEFLFYFISLFSFFHSPQHVPFFLLSSSAAGIYIVLYRVGGGSRGVLPQIDFIITFYFLGDKLPAHILNAHFVRTSKNFLATEVSLFSMCASVSVCPLTWSFIRSFLVGLCDKFFI